MHGLGVSPHKIGEIFGVFKAYCTRVGSGPFPTELLDNTGKLLRDRGYEYGSVTKRPRRCGWIDLVALRYTIMLNDVTKLVMMKSDVLDTFDTIRHVAYEIDGKETKIFRSTFPENIKPVYVELPGWKTDDKHKIGKRISQGVQFVPLFSKRTGYTHHHCFGRTKSCTNHYPKKK